MAAALLGAAFVACGTAAPATPAEYLTAASATGEWFAMDDQGPPDYGSSTIEMTETEVGGMAAHHFAGEVTTQFQWGFAGFGLEPDDETMELLKTAEAISFMIRGDGQRYSIQFQTSNVRDHGYFWFIFDTTAGSDVRVTIPMRHFMQPAWSVPVGRLNQELVTGLQWQTHESWRPGSFELTIWDVRLYR
jgi:hypothetical protein